MQRVGSSEGGVLKSKERKERVEKNINKLGCGFSNVAHSDTAKRETILKSKSMMLK